MVFNVILLSAQFAKGYEYPHNAFVNFILPSIMKYYPSPIHRKSVSKETPSITIYQTMHPMPCYCKPHG